MTFTLKKNLPGLGAELCTSLNSYRKCRNDLISPHPDPWANDHQSFAVCGSCLLFLGLVHEPVRVFSLATGLYSFPCVCASPPHPHLFFFLLGTLLGTLQIFRFQNPSLDFWFAKIICVVLYSRSEL
uniref:Uncharacterized protein n=1 Tax=Mus musculus TaxID=10090 RepID=Q3TTT5_MOUSE|nr:unnamed protein product [Mus musculus]